MPAAQSFDFRALIDEVPAIIWCADREASRFTFVSSYAETLFGYPRRRWTEETDFWSSHIIPEDRDITVASRRNGIHASGSYDLECRMMAADGEPLWVRELGVLTPAGDLAGVMVDLSRKRSVAQALSQGKLWLRQVVDTIPQEIWSGPPEGTIDFVNWRWRSELGITLEDVRAHPDTAWQRMLHPQDHDRVMQAWRESVANGTPYEQQERHRMADGSYRWFLCRGVPLRDAQGRITRWFGTNTDIQAQKEAEEELLRSEQRWRAMFENSSVGVADGFDAHFVAVNKAYEKMTGYTSEELRSLTCLDFTHEDDRPAYHLLTEELQSGQRERFTTEKRYRRKDGELTCVRINGSVVPSRTAGDRLWVAMVEDITEQKRLRDELDRERDWLLLMVNLARQLIAKLEVPSVVDAVLAGLEGRYHWQWAAILLPEPAANRLKVNLSRGAGEGPREGLTTPLEGTLAGAVFRSGQPMECRAEDLPRLKAEYPTYLHGC